MSFIIAFIRLLLVFTWLIITCGVGLIACLFKPFGADPNVITAHLFAKGALFITGTRLQVENQDLLYQSTPCIYVGNHQSGMDMATYGLIYPRNTKVIGKTELRWIPIFGFFLWAAGNILIHRQHKHKAISALDEAVQSIRKKNVSVWIFPEGTRNKACEGLKPFKKGAFHMAINAQIPVVPIVSTTLKGISVWENFDIKGGAVKLKVLPAISTQGLTKANVEELSNTVRETMLKALSTLS